MPPHSMSLATALAIPALHEHHSVYMSESTRPTHTFQHNAPTSTQSTIPPMQRTSRKPSPTAWTRTNLPRLQPAGFHPAKTSNPHHEPSNGRRGRQEDHIRCRQPTTASHRRSASFLNVRGSHFSMARWGEATHLQPPSRPHLMGSAGASSHASQTSLLHR